MTGQRQAITPPPHNGQESVVSSSSSSVDVGFIVKEAHPGTDRRPQPASVATVPQTSSYKYCTTEEVVSRQYLTSDSLHSANQAAAELPTPMQQWESEPIKNQPWSAITIIFGRFEEYGMESNGMEDMRAREKEEKIEDDITGLLESPRRSSIECLAASFHRAVGESEGDGERSSHC